jgi:hypothetical protein
VKHLTLGLEAFARDIRGEGKLRLKGTWWQRRLWRWTALPRILKTRQIFRPVRAPREVRPPEHPGEPAPLLEDLRLRARELEALVVETDRVNPHCCVTHPYFGALSL